MFWGLIVTFVGSILLLNSLFGFKLPLFRILFAALIVYIGVSMLIGAEPSMHIQPDTRATDHQAIFGTAVFAYPPTPDHITTKYSTIFGNSSLDLSSVQKLEAVSFEDMVIFGNSVILIKKGTPVRIETETIFGRTEVLQKNIDSFGKLSYASPDLKQEAPALTIKTSVIFGQLQILEKE